MPETSPTLAVMQNDFAKFPPAFYTHLPPTPLPAPYLIAASQDVASDLGLDSAALGTAPLLDIFTGNTLAPGSQPLAAVYSGHQFGVWAGQLGDGRAIVLGNLVDKQGISQEIQLKGAGKTPYSRMGDGRAVLRSSIREFLCSEAMEALGIPTTRALCITGSDQTVQRETLETAAVVTRVAPSFIRFGSFEHWYANQNEPLLGLLADTVIANWYPALAETPSPYAALLQEVSRRTAILIAQWQAVGFMHGVMNTDNMSILGLTLDYGPFGFMEGFDLQHICNHSDHQGRYAFHMQPRIGLWNCYALGQALVPLIGDVDETKEALAIYQTTYDQHYQHLMMQKLGLTGSQADDAQLLSQLMALMDDNKTDYPIFFRKLSDVQSTATTPEHVLRDLFVQREAFDQWCERYRARLRHENSLDAQRKANMDKVNPKYVLRNYLAQVAIDKAQQKDFSEVERLLRVLQKPFDEQPENDAYAAFPPDWSQQVCVSCSS